MVNLGLARRIDVIELGLPLVVFAHEEEPHEPVLRSWPYGERQLWELEITTTPHGNWPRELASCLRKMRWERWALDTASAAGPSGPDTASALAAWGDSFWPDYREDAVVYLLFAENSISTLEIARAWDRSYTHVCFRSKYDLTDRPIREKQPTPRGRLHRIRKKIIGRG
ncbi:MAG: hypothetical protein ACLFSY_03525 [Desulfonatronovibrionaceae bacterium]